MKKFHILSSLVLSLLASTATARFVEITTEEEFNDVINNGNVIVKFYATWCGACKHCAEPYKKVAQEFEDVTFANVDIDKLPEIGHEYAKEGYPTFVFFKDGEKIDDAVGGKSEEKIRQDARTKFVGSVDSSVDATHSEVSQQKSEHAAPAPAAEHHPESTGILEKIKAAIMWVFTTIKNVFVGIIDTIKGFFGRK